MLTRLEEKALKFITQYIASHGHSPTLTEIGRGLRIKSKGTVHRYVKSLVDKGHLHRTGRLWRGIRLTEKHNRRLTILPLRGRITPGKPVEDISTQKEINFSDLLLGADRYVLKVVGDSMIEEGILDGDMVIIRHTSLADNGDIVLAIVDDEETTLKRLRKHRARIELIPGNSSLASMIYPAERVKIEGVVVGQIRLY